MTLSKIGINKIPITLSALMEDTKLDYISHKDSIDIYIDDKKIKYYIDNKTNCLVYLVIS